MKNTIEKFISLLIEKDGCLIFTSTKNSDGYGRFSFNGKNRMAHKVAYEYWNGKIPDGLQVCHSCDNPPCCNPKHLFLGTNKENMEDKVAKGRQAFLRGENHGSSVLTKEQVDSIRSGYASGKRQTNLAKEFGISQPHVSSICRMERWK